MDEHRRLQACYAGRMTKKADPDLLRMTEQLQASTGGRGRRSSLFHWLFKRASNFDEMIKDRRPSWSSVAAAAAALDLKDGCGHPPTGERTRKTWFEVRRAKGWLDKTPASETIPHVDAVPQKSVDVRLNAFVAHSRDTAASMPVPPPPDSHQSALARMRAQFKPITIPQKQDLK